jgi:glycosyltransferase involved in cell wall biosynthesis
VTLHSGGEWSVIAHANAELGVGEIARRLFSLLVSSGINAEMVGINASKSRQGSKSTTKLAEFRNTSNVISCVNPDQLAMVIAQQRLYKSDLQNHIGYWAWELEDFPREFEPAFDLVNEIWTFSDFVKVAIQKKTKLSVRALPIPIPIPRNKTVFRRSDFEIPENEFLAVTSFDYFSDRRRKNPQATIHAYKQAFELRENSTLIVKSINSQYFSSDHQELKAIADGREDIIFIDDYFDADKNLALLELADVVISLHRSEGYGINLADAMARGTAVIATGYSGNLEFMNETNSALVSYSMVPVERYANLKVSSTWAEPNVDEAARRLRGLFENPDKAKALGASARAHIEREYSLAACVAKFKEILSV